MFGKGLYYPSPYTTSTAFLGTAAASILKHRLSPGIGIYEGSD